MAGAGYSNIDPIGGTGDRGRDALYRAGVDGELRIFAYTVRSDWRKKLEHDCNRIREEQHNPSFVTFVCTCALSGNEKGAAAAFVSRQYGWRLEIFDLERIRVLLSSTQRQLIAQHPAIFCPPWFPQRGGLSIAADADTVIIDHVPADHALATWLARRLTLAGFQTWCYGTAPLAGEDADESVRTLIQKRALQYLPIISTVALGDQDFLDRCGAAGAHDELLLPCWSDPVGDLLTGGKLGRIYPARFDGSWSVGLRNVLDRLATKGIQPNVDAERAKGIALREYVPVPVTIPAPERVFANVFPVRIPSSILICELSRPLDPAEMDKLRTTWAFVLAASTKLLAFEPPPASVPLSARPRIPEYAWDCQFEREGKRSTDVVKELIRRSLDVACVQAGLKWCGDRNIFYFPQEGQGQTNVPFRHVDGRDTRVAVNGERQYGWGDRASQFKYQLGPRFYAYRDDTKSWWVTVRLYVRVTDINGTPFQLKDIVRRRKAVTKNWWNKEWLARLLGVMQALRNNGGDITIGSGNRSVTVSTTPLEWHCPVAIDVAAIERVGDFQEEMAAMRYVDDDDEDADSEPTIEGTVNE